MLKTDEHSHGVPEGKAGDRGDRAQAKPSTPVASRSLPLDFLRAVAVLLVIIHHAPLTWLQALPIPNRLAGALWSGGWMGVDLFFVLSGFLIAGLLFREHQRYGTIQFKRFFLRRGLKIYPAFYVFLLFTVLFRYARTGEVSKYLWSEALLVQNYFGSMLPHTWSLAVEEHFYIALPVLLILLSRWRTKAGDPFHFIPRICLGLAVGALTLRVISGLVYTSYAPYIHFKPTHVRIDALMFGVFLAYLYHYRSSRFTDVCRRYYWPMILIGIWLFIPVFAFRLPQHAYIYTLGLTQVYVGSGLIVSALVVGGIPSNWFTRGMGYCGAYSYSIYLWHIVCVPMVKYWFSTARGGSRPEAVLALACYFVGSVVMGIVMARLIEIPVLRLRDRLFPSRSRQMTAPEETTAAPAAQ